MKIAALAGGVGASKFLLGLSSILSPDKLTVIANTGDDIELFGLRVCPDIDTITYTLAGAINEATGWGISGDTFESLKWLERYGEQAWFKLGDRDLATHIYRTSKLNRGETLTEVTEDIRRSLGVEIAILPMTDAHAPTRVATDEGEMHFQEYFVRRRCEPRVNRICLEAAESAAPAPGVLESIREADAVILCPSNPFISIGPILAVPGIRDALRLTRARVVAISPIIGGKALKGPAADMLRDLGHDVSALAVAELYRDFLDVFVIDDADSPLKEAIEALGITAVVTNTVMTTLEDKRRLARTVVDELASAAPPICSAQHIER